MPQTYFRAQENLNENTENDSTESDIMELESGSESVGSDYTSDFELEDPLYEKFAEALRSPNAWDDVENVLTEVKNIWSLNFNMLDMAIKHNCSGYILGLLYERYERHRNSNDKRRIIKLPFHTMATADNTSVVDFFPNDINEENDDGENALHIAALHGSRYMAQYLIVKARHLDKNVKGRDDTTPLHYAVRAGNPQTVKTLLRYGHRPTQEAAESIMRSLLLDNVPIEAALRILRYFTNPTPRRSREGLADPIIVLNDIGKYKADMKRARDKGRDQIVNRIELFAQVIQKVNR